MPFEYESEIAEILASLSDSKSGFNSAFLFGTEPLENTEYNHRTLRINSDLFGYQEEDVYPGTVYIPNQEVDDNIWISFESGLNFPNMKTAQAILAEETPQTDSNQVITYTLSPISRLERYSRDENEIKRNKDRRWRT